MSQQQSVSLNASAHAFVFRGVIAPPSVTFIEGTVSSLLEEDGCVAGLQYKDRQTGDTKVNSAALGGTPGAVSAVSADQYRVSRRRSARR